MSETDNHVIVIIILKICYANQIILNCVMTDHEVRSLRKQDTVAYIRFF